MYCDIIVINNYCFTDGPSKTLILHDIYTDGQSGRLEALRACHSSRNLEDPHERVSVRDW